MSSQQGENLSLSSIKLRDGSVITVNKSGYRKMDVAGKELESITHEPKLWCRSVNSQVGPRPYKLTGFGGVSPKTGAEVTFAYQDVTEIGTTLRVKWIQKYALEQLEVMGVLGSITDAELVQTRIGPEPYLP